MTIEEGVNTCTSEAVAKPARDPKTRLPRFQITTNENMPSTWMPLSLLQVRWLLWWAVPCGPGRVRGALQSEIPPSPLPSHPESKTNVKHAEVREGSRCAHGMEGNPGPSLKTLGLCYKTCGRWALWQLSFVVAYFGCHGVESMTFAATS